MSTALLTRSVVSRSDSFASFDVRVRSSLET